MKRLCPALPVLMLLLAACGGPGVGGDPDFAGGPLPEGSHVELNLGGTAYASSTGGAQIGMGRLPPSTLLVIAIIPFTPYGNCTLELLLADDITPGEHPSPNPNGLQGGAIACSDYTNPQNDGFIGSLTLEQADGRFMRGSLDVTQAFTDGAQPIQITGRFVVPYPN